MVPVNGLATTVLAATLVTVTWTPASQYTDGSPLPPERSWTLVEQHPQSCEQTTATSQPIDGLGRLISVLTPQAVFDQPKGTTYCYIARTIVWATSSATAPVSEPVRVNKTVPAGGGCGGCHE